jgi:hypothetical protein
MIDSNDWTMAERIAENSKTFKTPQQVISAFDDLMKQVEMDGNDD